MIKYYDKLDFIATCRCYGFKCIPRLKIDTDGVEFDIQPTNGEDIEYLYSMFSLNQLDNLPQPSLFLYYRDSVREMVRTLLKNKRKEVR